MSSNELDNRLSRALSAYLRQEVQAPAIAVTEFLDIIIDDARELKLDPMLADLDRMRVASVRLTTFVNGLIDNAAADRQQDESAEAFQRRLRHDLRTPLNAIIGYSELLIEDTLDGVGGELRGDLEKLLQSATSLLGQIDAMVTLTQEPDAAGGSRQLGVLADVQRSLEPAASATHATVQASDILVVDDNMSNRDVLSRRLEREGHRVETAENGALALEAVSKRDFDLVLLDLIMPEMNGFEVLRRLKASEHTAHIPVIVLSALDDIDSIVQCVESGADDYLSKPFDPTLLRARINASLERKGLRDRERKFIAELEQEKRRSETLLLNILPHSIVERMRTGETAIADSVAEVTILFCDLVGFTALSQHLPANRTIDFLSQIFSRFDQLVAEYGVEKIKTVGDSYMVAGGIPEPLADHAYRVASLAPRMLDAVEQIARSTALKLEARIGIHTGPVVAGVIGTHKFIYDVWGDTVNTASRMESHSLTGRIQISAVTRNALGDRFVFEPRGMIDIKGKGAMETYFLGGSAE